MRPLIIISAINVFNAGPLSIVRDCLKELSEKHNNSYRIFAFVFKKELFQDIKYVKFIEFF